MSATNHEHDFSVLEPKGELRINTTGEIPLGSICYMHSGNKREHIGHFPDQGALPGAILRLLGDFRTGQLADSIEPAADRRAVTSSMGSLHGSWRVSSEHGTHCRIETLLQHDEALDFIAKPFPFGTRIIVSDGAFDPGPVSLAPRSEDLEPYDLDLEAYFRLHANGYFGTVSDKAVSENRLALMTGNRHQGRYSVFSQYLVISPTSGDRAVLAVLTNTIGLGPYKPSTTYWLLGPDSLQASHLWGLVTPGS